MPVRRGSVNSRILTDLLRYQIDLTRLTAAERRRVERILNEMMRELAGRLSVQDITRFNKERLNQMLVTTRASIETYYARMVSGMNKTMGAVAEIQARQAATLLERAFVAVEFTAALPTDTFLARLAANSIIQGAASEEWWSRQARDVAFRFSNAVRQGLVAGDTSEQIVSRVVGRGGHPGIVDVSRANARSLVHASVQQAAADARFETFRQNGDIVEGIRQISTLDSNTTDICMAYDGAEFDLDGNPINGTTLPYENGVPRHWGCRSVEVPITKTFKELGLDIPEPGPGQRASSEGPVSGRVTFDDFLGRLSKEEQDEMLGVGRAELWRDGSITLQQLLDQRGNPLSLDELRRRYA